MENSARLLNRIAAHYHKTFFEDSRAMEYLKSRGITHNAVYQDFTIGYSNGTLMNMIPDKGDVRDALMEIGLLTETGRELFHECVVFPVFDENRACADLCGYRIADRNSEYVYLPGSRRGILTFQINNRCPYPL